MKLAWLILVSFGSFCCFIKLFRWQALCSKSGYMLKFMQNHYKDRTLTARGRSQAPVRSPRSNSNGRIATSQEKILPDRNCRERELSQAQFHSHQGSGKFGFSDLRYASSPENKHYSNVNGSMHLSERMVEYGSIGHPPLVVSTTGGGGHPNSGSAPAHNSSVSPAIPGMQGPKPVPAIDHDR